MFGWMGIDIHQCRIEFEIQDVGRVPAMKEDILVGLAYGV